MSEYDDLMQMFTEIASVPASKVVIRQIERRSIFHDCGKDLKLVNGAMQNVGEATILGTAYEFRIEVRKEKK